MFKLKQSFELKGRDTMKHLFLLSTLLIGNAFALELNEKVIVEWARHTSFNKHIIDLQKLNASINKEKFNENFIYQLDAQANYMKTKETSFSSFVPVSSPIENFELKLSKATKKGIHVTASASTGQVSNNYYSNGTTSTVSASIKFDLYKDFLGRLTSVRENSLKYKDEIAKAEARISETAFVSEVRKLYWSIVANNEALSISKRLLKTAEKLEKDTYNRFKSNVADKGELARIRSQVQARNGQIYVLEYERSNLYRKLRELFPEQMKATNIELEKYNLDKVVQQVLACTMKISQSNELPNNYTEYDDILELLKVDLEAQVAANTSYSKPDLALVTETKLIGKDFSYSDSFTEVADEGKSSVSVGLVLNIPLGSQKKTTEALQKEMITKQSIAKYKEVSGKLSAFHVETLKSIKVLNNVIAAQKRNTILLDQTLTESNKKFKQARISARDLIQDEDSLLQSNLDEINTKYNVIATIIDYFSVYNQTPCEMNI